MIKKEIGCTDIFTDGKGHDCHFPFIPCRLCYQTQGDIGCIDFRNSTGAKMTYNPTLENARIPK